MKNLVLILTLLTSSLFAQTGINYQGAATDSDGAKLTNQNISLRTSVLQGGVDGITSYTETHNTTTDQFGLFNVIIGQGEVVSGAFDSISWGADAHFLKVELDATGGTNYNLVSTTQMMSVPYALYSEKSKFDTLEILNLFDNFSQENETFKNIIFENYSYNWGSSVSYQQSKNDFITLDTFNLTPNSIIELHGTFNMSSGTHYNQNFSIYFEVIDENDGMFSGHGYLGQSLNAINSGNSKEGVLYAKYFTKDSVTIVLNGSGNAYQSSCYCNGSGNFSTNFYVNIEENIKNDTVLESSQIINNQNSNLISNVDSITIINMISSALSAQGNSSIPTGTVQAFAGEIIPDGWMLCDGSAISRTDYHDLFEVIGEKYGTGDGTFTMEWSDTNGDGNMQQNEFTNIPSTFNIPDLRGRVIIGPDNMGGNNAGVVQNLNDIGITGGSENHTLTIDEIPNHTHEIELWTPGSSGSQVSGTVGIDTFGQVCCNNGSSGWHNITNQSDIRINGGGGDQPHTNMQPYSSINYIIKL